MATIVVVERTDRHQKFENLKFQFRLGQKVTVKIHANCCQADRAPRSVKMVFREDNVVVIEVGSLTTRAVVGLVESMTPPQVRVPTKIGVKRASRAQQPQYLFDEELEDAIRAKDPELTVIQPIVKGVVRDWEAIEIFW